MLVGFSITRRSQFLDGISLVPNPQSQLGNISDLYRPADFKLKWGSNAIHDKIQQMSSVKINKVAKRTAQ